MKLLLFFYILYKNCLMIFLNCIEFTKLLLMTNVHIYLININ